MRPFNRMIISIFFWALALSAQVQDVPDDVAAAVLLKTAGFETGVSSSGAVTVYVLGAPAVADELKKGIGLSVGKAVLKSVESGETMPSEPPSILFIGNKDLIENALQYTQQNQILSVAGNPEMVKKGAALGFGIGNDGKPRIYLNLSSSVKEGLEWNPAILKIAKTVQ